MRICWGINLVNFLLLGLNLFLKKRKKNKMGQKTNPIIFNISKTKQWKATYSEKKSNEFYLYTLRQLEIKKFINRFFNVYKLKVKECKINYKDTFLHIYISYYQSNLSLIKLKNINKTQNIKLKNKQIFKKRKENKIKNLLKHTKNFYNFNKYNDLIYLKKLSILNKNIVLSEKLKQKKLKRLKLLTYYKQYMLLNKTPTLNNLTLNSFSETLFESLNIFLNKKINISFVLESLNTANNKNKIIDKKEQFSLKKKLIRIKKYQQSKFFKEGINLIYTALKNEKSAELLSNYIATTLQKEKRHNYFLRFLKTLLTMLKKKRFSSISSIKIKIKGRLNKSRRSKHKVIRIGNKMPLLTFNSNIDYAEEKAFTSNGTFGVKVWIC